MHRTESKVEARSCLPCINFFAKREGDIHDSKHVGGAGRHHKLFMPTAFAVLLRRAQQQTVRDVFVNGVSPPSLSPEATSLAVHPKKVAANEADASLMLRRCDWLPRWPSRERLGRCGVISRQ